MLMNTYIPGDGEVAQQLKASTALAKDLNVAPSNYSGWLTAASSFTFRGSDTPFCVPWPTALTVHIPHPIPYITENMYDLHTYVCV